MMAIDEGRYDDTARQLALDALKSFEANGDRLVKEYSLY